MKHKAGVWNGLDLPGVFLLHTMGDGVAMQMQQYLSEKELGERLGLSFSGAKSRVQRAREKIKQKLLACCHFELDRQNHIPDDQQRCDSCEQSVCSDEVLQRNDQQARPFLEWLRLFK